MTTRRRDAVDFGPITPDQAARMSRGLQRLGRDYAVQVRKLAVACQRAGEAMNRMLASFPRWVLVVDDPAERKPRNARELAAQMRDIFLHEFYCAGGEPERSPGARWELRTPNRR